MSVRRPAEADAQRARESTAAARIAADGHATGAPELARERHARPASSERRRAAAEHARAATARLTAAADDAVAAKDRARLEGGADGQRGRIALPGLVYGLRSAVSLRYAGRDALNRIARGFAE